MIKTGGNSMAKNIKTSKELKNIVEYELIKEEGLDELGCLGLVFKHKKSKARVVVLSSDDNNKVFSIGFRTPPTNSTGVAHILEHSVLCGSKNFPSKDPFVELVKGSLNTFLNAMTYPDKTIYPVASCNDKDFSNLMHVYLDAVFYPNIYEKEEIFKQEGWHLELESEEGELKYNGVVYNEMKGVYSSPEQIIFRQIQQSLFPDTTYGAESGGDPEYITDLSYEEFLGFHKKYYHPSNSYIYLYGDIDIEEKLEFIDKEYLSKFESLDVDSEVKMQKPFSSTKEVVEYYSVSEDDSLEDKTYLSYNTVIETSLDKELYLALQVLEFVLLSSPGAPLKQALIDNKIGKDILSSYDNGMLQPMFSIIAKNTEQDRKEEFVKIIFETLEEIKNKGIDKKALKAAINFYEFKYKEADFGNFPKGLMYGIQILDSWLYDDSKPFIHIKAEQTFEELKEKIDTDYFETLIDKYLLKNPHNSIVIVKPKVGLSAKAEKEVSDKLQEYKASLTKQEKIKLIEESKKLVEFQETPSTKEELEKIPLLSREDIGKKSRPIINEIKQVADIKVIHHNIFTNKIAYIKMLFDVTTVPNELIPYLGLLSTVLGYIDTTDHTFLELSNEININTGGIGTDMNVYSKRGSTEDFNVKFEVRSKVLYENMNHSFALIEEIITKSKLDDEKRLKEIIAEIKSRLQMKMNSAGHSVAVSRALSYFSKVAYFNELTSGISFYQFIDKLDSDFDNNKEELIVKLKSLMKHVFRKDNLILSCTADDEGYEAFEEQVNPFVEKLNIDKVTNEVMNFEPVSLNEGFKTPGKVQFVARAGNFIKAGFKYTGALKVLKVILSYDYLWTNIRVKGGAYGCMCGFSLEGNGFFTSYRDPNLSETNAIYEKVGDYIKNFDADERDMTKYIIGTISGMDTPMNPSAVGSRSLSLYLSGMTLEDIQKDRNEVLSTTKEDIRGLAELVMSVLKAGNICVVGNEQKIEENKDLFHETTNLM